MFILNVYIGELLNSEYVSVKLLSFCSIILIKELLIYWVLLALSLSSNKIVLKSLTIKLWALFLGLSKKLF